MNLESYCEGKNALNGTIPVELGNISSITDLDIGKKIHHRINYFQHKCFDIMMTQLQCFFLLQCFFFSPGTNVLDGSLPVELSRLSELINLDVCKLIKFASCKSPAYFVTNPQLSFVVLNYSGKQNDW